MIPHTGGGLKTSRDYIPRPFIITFSSVDGIEIFCGKMCKTSRPVSKRFNQSQIKKLTKN